MSPMELNMTFRFSSPNNDSPKLRQQCLTVECIIGRNFGHAGTLGCNKLARNKKNRRVNTKEKNRINGTQEKINLRRSGNGPFAVKDLLC
jgi:hypothetical protein